MMFNKISDELLKLENRVHELKIQMLDGIIQDLETIKEAVVKVSEEYDDNNYYKICQITGINGVIFNYPVNSDYDIELLGDALFLKNKISIKEVLELLSRLDSIGADFLVNEMGYFEKVITKEAI